MITNKNWKKSKKKLKNNINPSLKNANSKKEKTI